MFMKWTVFLFLLCYDVGKISAAPSPLSDLDIDVKKLQYPTYPTKKGLGNVRYMASGVLIIPEELPSLLSVAYSNIPPIKKGTDSRVGFGFAFGNHADFQVMFELGPQTNTKPLDGQGFQASTNTKRQAPPPPKITKNREKLLQTEASTFLQTWAQKMKQPQNVDTYQRKPGDVPNLEDSMVELVKNDNGEYEVHQPKPGNLPSNILEELMKLYKLKKDEVKEIVEHKRSEEEIKKITDDLSNVDLD